MADGAVPKKTNDRWRELPAKRLSPLDCMCDALRRAKELALNVGAVADGVGWPCLWLPKHVRIYGPRPDGKCQIEDLTDTDEVYYVTQIERALANVYFKNSSLELFHVDRPVLQGAVAMPNTCVARVGTGPSGLPPPLAVCEGNQVLWIADTGRGHWWRTKAFGAC